MRFFVGGLFALLSCVAITDGVWAAQAACTATKIKYVTGNAGGTTHSTTPDNFSSNTVNFMQGAGGGCVIARFSAMAQGSNFYPVAVRAIIDGATVALPGEVVFSDGVDEEAQVRAFDFIFASVAAGT